MHRPQCLLVRVAGSDDVPSVSGKPPLAAALESQLGLQLQPATASPGALVIEHVARPTTP